MLPLSAVSRHTGRMDLAAEFDPKHSIRLLATTTNGVPAAGREQKLSSAPRVSFGALLQESEMRRRSFIALLGGAASWTLAAGAQQPAKTAKIGWMSQGNVSTPDINMNAFREGMRELGYAEGQNCAIEARYADGNVEVMPAQAMELEQLGVDVIVAGPFAALQAAKSNTSRVPIIMTPSADPVVTGIVTSLDHPGGNITGITEMMPELAAPRGAVLKEIIPDLRQIAVLWRPGTLSPATIEQVQRDIEISPKTAGTS